MKAVKKALLTAAVLAVAAPATASAGLLSDASAIVSAGATGAVTEYRTDTSISLARAGVAELGTRTPIPFNAHFRIGSTTKTFVAVSILKLVQDGRLSLSDPVERWLPGVVDGNGNDGSRITIRMLLQQTSGLADYFDYLPVLNGSQGFFDHRYDIYTEEEMVALAMEYPPYFAPGTGWEYSNTNYAVLGMVLKAVTGQPWPTVVRNRILIPLGLEETSWPGTNRDIPAPFAHGYEMLDAGGPLYDVTSQIETPTGDGGMISTLGDLNKFFSSLLKGQLLNSTLMAQMKTVVPAPSMASVWPGAEYGLGLVRLPLSCGGYLWTHGGDTFGFMTRVGVSPDGRRRVTVSVPTELSGDVDALLNEDRLARDLVDHALC
jgi:D-alanyl-D-alanine carboxypeptidase